MSWIQTYNALKADPLYERNCMVIDIEDIAHALSNICRFTGHVKDFYSVAQHSTFVAARVAPELQLAALLHDAAEAYLGDIARPLKQELSVGDVSVSEVEKELLRKIFDDLNVRWPDDEGWTEIKYYDNVALLTEADQLLKGGCIEEWDKAFPEKAEQRPLYPMYPTAAKAAFLGLYEHFRNEEK